MAFTSYETWMRKFVVFFKFFSFSLFFGMESHGCGTVANRIPDTQETFFYTKQNVVVLEYVIVWVWSSESLSHTLLLIVMELKRWY